MTETTTIAAESFLTEQTEVEAILSAAGVLGVELKLVNGTVTATGKGSRRDDYLKGRIAKAKAEGVLEAWRQAMGAVARSQAP